MSRTSVVLVHGGLYEDVDPATFWGKTGIGSGLRAAGYSVIAPIRPQRPRSWEAERDALVVAVTSATTPPVAIVAASNGCSVALRALADVPELAAHLVLCWPATAGIPEYDAAVRQRVLDVAGTPTADRLLAGETIRGLLDEELETIATPVTIVPSEAHDPFHTRETVDQLVRCLPSVRVLEPVPPALWSEFRHYRSRFVAMLVDAIG
jgi:hypothetical protein